MKTLRNKLSEKLFSLFTLSFVLISTSLLSQGLFDNDNYTEEAITIEDWMCTNDLINDELTNENYIEEPIQLQDWMFNDQMYNSIISETYAEEEIPLQNWMVDTEPLFEFNQELSEPLIAIQDWMVSYDNFSTKVDFNYLFSDAEEAPLAIDAWMINYEIFKEKTLAPIAPRQSIKLIPIQQQVFIASQTTR